MSTINCRNEQSLPREEFARILAERFRKGASTSGMQVFATSGSMELPKVDPKLAASLKIIFAMVQSSSDWESALRAGSIALLDCIPFVGGLVAGVTSIFWSVSKPSVWDQVKDQVKEMVDMGIYDLEYARTLSEIRAMKTSLVQYMNSPSRVEQGNILSATMVLMNSLYESVAGSKNSHILIGLMAPIGILHLTVLSERYTHYKELFGSDNRAQAKKELQTTYTQYHDFFAREYPKWRDYRSEKLAVSQNRVKDGLGKFNFISNKDSARADGFKQASLRKCIADMAQLLSATKEYPIFLKGLGVSLAPILPELDTLVLGPYIWTRLQGTGDYNPTQIGGWTNDKPTGDVHSIDVWAYNSIDGIQFHYPGFAGTKVTGGGGAHSNVLAGHCTGVKLDYSSGIVYKMQFVFADGSLSSVYGNKGGWDSISHVDATVGRAYKLTSGNFVLGSGPSRTKGVNGVELTFRRV